MSDTPDIPDCGEQEPDEDFPSLDPTTETYIFNENDLGEADDDDFDPDAVEPDVPVESKEA